MAVNDTPEMSGYVQINDSGWDSHSAVDALVELISKDPDMSAPRGKYQGYQHDMIAARFRHSVGRFLLTMIQFSKPTISGMQGRIS